MHEWHLTSSDPMAPRIAADARSGRTDYDDDQVWQLHLGAPDEPAISLETRYGGRVGLARLVPLWTIGRRQVLETQGYHAPPELVAFAPDYLRVRAGLTAFLDVIAEFWTMESQVVGGRFTVTNRADQPQTLRLDLVPQIARERETVPMLFLTLDDGQIALQLGRLKGLQPVLLVEGARDGGASARLGSIRTLDADAETTWRWTLAARPDRDESLRLAHRWLADDAWDRHFAVIARRQDTAPQVETGDPGWDLALAWSQQLVLRSFLGATGHLPHPSFVLSRTPAQGFATGGGHGGGFVHPWGGQSLPDALTIAGTVALAAPELAQGLVRNFLAVQRADGWIDARPGLGGQRANVLAPPLLATLAYEVYTFTRDRDFLAECRPGARALFERWFQPDTDADGDGIPEWQDAGQGAFGDGPTLAPQHRRGQGVDITTLEAPDLLSALVREARTLLGMCKMLGDEDTARAIRPRFEALQATLDEFWHEEPGVFAYRDRDSHACPTGDTVYAGRGDDALTAPVTLAQPGRLIVRIIGGLNRKPKLTCTIEGTDAAGHPARETIAGDRFDWYRGGGAATTDTVWGTVTALHTDGLSRVFKVEVRTVDLSAHDQALFLPLWSGVLDDERTARLVAHLTDPARYWREYGVCGCPADDPRYDPTLRNGCGGLWPDWNARLGIALIECGYRRESAELFRRVLAAQARGLAAEGTFRALLNPDTGEGLGEADSVRGAVAWGWFARLFGAFALDAERVMILGPFAFDEGAMTWTQHGVRITRSPAETTIAFPGGQTVTLPPDAAAQIVRDSGVRPRRPADR